jgi:FOG: CBS domain
MKISEVMTRDVQTVRPDQTAREAASFMLRANAGAIPVAEGDRLVGMITDRDIAVRGIAEGHGRKPRPRPHEQRYGLRAHR